MTFHPQNDPFPFLRQVVDPSIAMLPYPRLRARIDSRFGDGTAESIEGDLEGVFDGFTRAISSAARDVGRFASQAAPVVAQIGGGAIQGAMAGSSAGLPGIIAGAALGGTGAGLSRFGSGTARDIGNAMTGITSFAGQFSPMGRLGQTVGGTLGALGGGASPGKGPGAGAGGALSSVLGALGRGGGGQNLAGTISQLAGPLASLFGGSSAAGQLASAMQRPELQQALAAMRLGNLGRSSIPVGSAQTAVPTGAFTQLLSQLAGQVAHEYAESAATDSEAAEMDFMRDGRNGFHGDPVSVADRAARLWALLNAAQSEHLSEAIVMESVAAEAAWYDGDQSDQAEMSDQYESDAAHLDQLDYAEAEAIEAELDAMEFSDAFETGGQSHVW